MGLSAEDYAVQLRQLLPYGPAWDGDHPLLQGGAAQLARIDAQAEALSTEETNPLSTTWLLPRYEKLCGLPDSCTLGGSQTIADRQGSLDAKMNAVGGINEAFYLRQLAALGYPDATITRYHNKIFTAGSRAGEALNSHEWRYVWEVNLPAVGKVRHFAPGSAAGDALRTWGDAEVQCVISKLAPSHTHVTFRYQGE